MIREMDLTKILFFKGYWVHLTFGDYFFCYFNIPSLVILIHSLVFITEEVLILISSLNIYFFQRTEHSIFIFRNKRVIFYF